ncbi:hypothetical protein BH09PSE6_BH09PSE6_26540 [soil metagenome]
MTHDSPDDFHDKLNQALVRAGDQRYSRRMFRLLPLFAGRGDRQRIVEIHIARSDGSREQQRTYALDERNLIEPDDWVGAFIHDLDNGVYGPPAEPRHL